MRHDKRKGEEKKERMKWGKAQSALEVIILI